MISHRNELVAIKRGWYNPSVASIRDTGGAMKGYHLRLLCIMHWIAKISTGFAELGCIIGLLILVPIWGPFAYLAWYYAGMDGVIGLFIAVLIFLSVIGIRELIRDKKLASIANKSNFQICIWCKHPLVGCDSIGRCSECGCGYWMDVNQELCRRTMKGSDKEKRKNARASTRLWARAYRERNRFQD